jgi:hypothetical protein
MIDIPELLIVLLTALLVVLWTRHWMLHHRTGPTQKPLRDAGTQPAPHSSAAKDTQAN